MGLGRFTVPWTRVLSKVLPAKAFTWFLTPGPNYPGFAFLYLPLEATGRLSPGPALDHLHYVCILHAYHLHCLHRLCFQLCSFQGKMELLFKVILLRIAAFSFILSGPELPLRTGELGENESPRNLCFSLR